MKIYTKDETKLHEEKIILKILKGNLFIYPTDTIYGIGCNAKDNIAVKNLRDTKRQNTRPLSIIAPNKKWIYDNCIINPKIETWIDKLPGPYTLILNLKNNKAIAQEVNLSNKTIGVRIPNNWFMEIIKKANIPIITTSANITGENFVTNIEQLDENIKINCSFSIDEGEKKGKPSTLIDLTSKEITIKERK
ncbi:MAG: L-threonylcarbamoyladenylate synthase [Nanoarchaeota archaeon]